MMGIDTAALIQQYGLTAVFVCIGLESMGLPLPGETVLILATVAAASGNQLSLWHVLAIAIVAAVIGDNAGYVLGRFGGWPLARRYGRYVRVDQSTLKVGRYLFARHGGAVVFGGRFVAVLRTLAAFLAGVNHMPWRRFLVFNALGGALWASMWAGLAYAFGAQVQGLPVALRVAILGGIIAAALGVGMVVRHRWRRYEAAAEAAYPGVLT